MTDNILDPSAFRAPAISLAGVVDYAMYQSFREQLSRAPEKGLVVTELSTLGGDPEVARMMGEDVRYHSDLELDRHFVFLGKAAIYSAGTTFMSFFARDNRYLTRGTRLMIHERKLSKTLQIDGPLTTCVATVKATLNEIEASIAIQNEGFREPHRRIKRDDGAGTATVPMQLVHRIPRGARLWAYTRSSLRPDGPLSDQRQQGLLHLPFDRFEHRMRVCGLRHRGRFVVDPIVDIRMIPAQLL
jgi:hypothetical protein